MSVREMIRAAAPVFAAIVMTLAPRAGLAAGSGRFLAPGLEGHSVRVDFGTPFIEEWKARWPDPFERRPVPGITRAAWPGVTGHGAWPERAAALDGAGGAALDAFFSEEALFFRVRRELSPGQETEHFEILLRVPAAEGRFIPREESAGPLFRFSLEPDGKRLQSRDGDGHYETFWEARADFSGTVMTAWMMIPFAALELGGPVPEIEIAHGFGRRASADPSARRIVLEGVTGREAAEPAIAGTPSRPRPGIGEGLAFEWVNGVARPRDRWIEGKILVDDRLRAPGDLVEVSLFAPGEGPALDRAVVEALRPGGRVSVDLRRWGLPGARVSARLLRDGQELAAAESLVAAEPLPAPFPDGFRIELRTNIPQGQPPVGGAWPLTAGVPFPPGSAWGEEGWQVEDASGTAWPAQFEVTGRWSLDGPARWLRVDTVAPPGETLYLVRRPGSRPPVPEQPARAVLEGGTVILSNGLTTWEIEASGSPVRRVSAGGRPVADGSSGRGLYLVDQRGRLARASSEGAEILVESDGPVTACVRVEGDYRTGDGEVLARHVTRVELAAGQPFARVVHTLVLTRDTNETWFREAGWEFEVFPGESPESVFAVSRDDPALYRRLPAGAGEKFLLQESYFRFGAGEKKFRLKRGEDEILSGEEMGDWFLFQGAGGGLAISCREAARQHPKEFNVTGNRMNLLLFSGRAGEEMDFRTETLVERWNLRDWFAGFAPHQVDRLESRLETVGAIRSDALGWAKTHEIMLMPLAGPVEPGEAAARSRLHSRPFFTLADPWWIYRSGAMGPLYPRDTDRFPEAERLVDATLSFFASRGPVFGLWGFFDYNAGPPFLHRDGERYPMPRRWGIQYTLQSDAWLVFARSGSREAFEFATGTGRAFADNYLASWGDGAGKIKGLRTFRDAPDAWTGSSALPFYWGHATVPGLGHMSNLDQLAWDYHLTGWRRAADQLRDFAEGQRRAWTRPEKRRAWNVLPHLRLLMQCYEFTWEDEFRELALNAFDYILDPAGDVGINKDRCAYRSSTYKARVHFRDLVAAWEFFGDPRMRDVALRVTGFNWNRKTLNPVDYTGCRGLAGNFLYRETGDRSIPGELLLAVRWASALLDRRSPGHGVSFGTPYGTFIFEGIPAALDVISRTNSDRAPVVSWAAASDFGGPLEFFLRKDYPDTLVFKLRNPAERHEVGGPRLEKLDPASMGPETMSAFLGAGKNGLHSRWLIPRDVPEGVFRVVSEGNGEHHGLAWGTARTPKLVLHAPSWWLPIPPQDPPSPWYFRVPENSPGAALFFESVTRLVDPAGDTWRETDGTPQWVEMPGDRPGLWSFVPLESGLVKSRNLPPFFAAGNPESWFEPPLAWERAPEQEPGAPMPGETGFVPGAGGGRGLYISPGGRFSFAGGEELGGGRGREFLPFHEGTVEFWLKPVDWHTFGMPGAPREELVSRRIVQFDRWRSLLDYGVNYPDPSSPAHMALRSWIPVAGPAGRRWSMVNYRSRTVIEPREWIHVAITWGPHTRDHLGHRRTGMRFAVFLNGRRGTGHRSSFHSLVDHLPVDKPGQLIFPGLGGVIDHLRVSDIVRYEKDFEPRLEAPEIDARTRAWFSFEDGPDGLSGEGKTITGLVTP